MTVEERRAWADAWWEREHRTDREDLEAFMSLPLASKIATAGSVALTLSALWFISWALAAIVR